jgi:DNA mismatch endonuclease (patch repair protein)
MREIFFTRTTMDTVSKAQRSATMRAVKSQDTKPELLVQHLVRSLGFRLRKNVKDLPGRPDLASKKMRKAIFVHGCFWHRHEGCARASMPSTNDDVWRNKFEKTKKRDAQTLDVYASMQWEVLVIWECELRERERITAKITAFLKA